MRIQTLFECRPIFETERLLLRKFTMDDVEAYFELGSNPAITDHMYWGPYQSIEDSIRYISSVIKKYENGDAYHWAIINKENSQLIGRTGFAHIDKSNRKVEIGYMLSDRLWNRGIGTEAGKLIVRYGFEELAINRIEARCSVIISHRKKC